jgi:hypothetical protein
MQIRALLPLSAVKKPATKPTKKGRKKPTRAAKAA